jgi:hypothetical protein
VNAPAPASRPQRRAAQWFLTFFVVGFVALAWLRGMGRVVLPLLALGALAFVVARVTRALRAPVE